jgi:transcriptional regulator with XRE-family HTH domain
MLYFGLKLKQLRMNRKLTQQQLADKLGVTKATISAYETQAKHPSVEVLIQISRLFEVSSDYLLDLSDHPQINVSSLTDEQVMLIQSLIQQFNLLNNIRE